MINNMIANKFESFLKVITGKFPAERLSYFLIPDLKIQQTFFYCAQICKIIWGKSFLLNNRKINFNLVKPAGMDWQMNGNSVRPSISKAFNEGFASMRRTIVYNPKNPIGCFVKLFRHYLVYQSIE